MLSASEMELTINIKYHKIFTHSLIIIIIYFALIFVTTCIQLYTCNLNNRHNHQSCAILWLLRAFIMQLDVGKLIISRLERVRNAHFMTRRQSSLFVILIYICFGSGMSSRVISKQSNAAAHTRSHPWHSRILF
jgi:hypothetical protein